MWNLQGRNDMNIDENGSRGIISAQAVGAGSRYGPVHGAVHNIQNIKDVRNDIQLVQGNQRGDHQQGGGGQQRNQPGRHLQGQGGGLGYSGSNVNFHDGSSRWDAGGKGQNKNQGGMHQHKGTDLNHLSHQNANPQNAPRHLYTKSAEQPHQDDNFSSRRASIGSGTSGSGTTMNSHHSRRASSDNFQLPAFLNDNRRGQHEGQHSHDHQKRGANLESNGGNQPQNNQHSAQRGSFGHSSVSGHSSTGHSSTQAQHSSSRNSLRQGSHGSVNTVKNGRLGSVVGSTAGDLDKNWREKKKTDNTNDYNTNNWYWDWNRDSWQEWTGGQQWTDREGKWDRNSKNGVKNNMSNNVNNKTSNNGNNNVKNETVDDKTGGKWRSYSVDEHGDGGKVCGGRSHVGNHEYRHGPSQRSGWENNNKQWQHQYSQGSGVNNGAIGSHNDWDQRLQNQNFQNVSNPSPATKGGGYRNSGSHHQQPVSLQQHVQQAHAHVVPVHVAPYPASHNGVVNPSSGGNPSPHAVVAPDSGGHVHVNNSHVQQRRLNQVIANTVGNTANWWVQQRGMGSGVFNSANLVPAQHVVLYNPAQIQQQFQYQQNGNQYGSQNQHQFQQFQHYNYHNGQGHQGRSFSHPQGQGQAQVQHIASTFNPQQQQIVYPPSRVGRSTREANGFGQHRVLRGAGLQGGASIEGEAGVVDVVAGPPGLMGDANVEVHEGISPRFPEPHLHNFRPSTPQDHLRQHQALVRVASASHYLNHPHSVNQSPNQSLANLRPRRARSASPVRRRTPHGHSEYHEQYSLSYWKAIAAAAVEPPSHRSERRARSELQLEAAGAAEAAEARGERGNGGYGVGGDGFIGNSNDHVTEFNNNLNHPMSSDPTQPQLNAVNNINDTNLEHQHPASPGDSRSLRHLCNDYNHATVALKNQQKEDQKQQDKQEASALIEKNELFNQLEKNSKAVERELRVVETARLAAEMSERVNYVLEQRIKKGDVGVTSIVSPSGRGLDGEVYSSHNSPQRPTTAPIFMQSPRQKINNISNQTNSVNGVALNPPRHPVTLLEQPESPTPSKFMSPPSGSPYGVDLQHVGVQQHDIQNIQNDINHSENVNVVNVNPNRPTSSPMNFISPRSLDYEINSPTSQRSNLMGFQQVRDLSVADNTLELRREKQRQYREELAQQQKQKKSHECFKTFWTPDRNAEMEARALGGVDGGAVVFEQSAGVALANNKNRSRSGSPGKIGGLRNAGVKAGVNGGVNGTPNDAPMIGGLALQQKDVRLEAALQKWAAKSTVADIAILKEGSSATGLQGQVQGQIQTTHGTNKRVATVGNTSVSPERPGLVGLAQRKIQEMNLRTGGTAGMGGGLGAGGPGSGPGTGVVGSDGEGLSNNKRVVEIDYSNVDPGNLTHGQQIQRAAAILVKQQQQQQQQQNNNKPKNNPSSISHKLKPYTTPYKHPHSTHSSRRPSKTSSNGQTGTGHPSNNRDNRDINRNIQPKPISRPATVGTCAGHRSNGPHGQHISGTTPSPRRPGTAGMRRAGYQHGQQHPRQHMRENMQQDRTGHHHNRNLQMVPANCCWMDLDWG